MFSELSQLLEWQGIFRLPSAAEFLTFRKDTDSIDHKSHVAFLSTGPDNGTCTDPEFPVTLPRIFMEANIVSQ